MQPWLSSPLPPSPLKSYIPLTRIHGRLQKCATSRRLWAPTPLAHWSVSRGPEIGIGLTGAGLLFMLLGGSLCHEWTPVAPPASQGDQLLPGGAVPQASCSFLTRGCLRWETCATRDITAARGDAQLMSEIFPHRFSSCILFSDQMTA